jgi:hypothetical protein
VAVIYSGRYVDGAWQLPLFCLSLCLASLDTIVSGSFKARGVMRFGYASQIATGVIAIAAGLILIPMQGTLVYATLVTTAIGLVISVILPMRERG